MDEMKRGSGAAVCGWESGAVQGESRDSAQASSRRPAQRAPGEQGDAEPRARPTLAIIIALARAVENEIIPRLLQARHDTEERMRAADKPTMPEEVVEFVELVLSGDETAVHKHIDRLRADGVTVETLYLELFTGAARRLGEFWTADRCNFVQVTLAVMLLQRLVHELGPDFQAEVPPLFNGHSSLLLPLPGEQHNFGLSIVAQYFRRDGWDVCSEMIGTTSALVDVVRERDFSMLGLSASCDSHLDVMASRIAMVRRSARNKSMVIMVGGHVFNEQPSLVAKVGADFSASDARKAVLTAREILERRLQKAR